MSDIILYEKIREKIITLRNQRVILDCDLAELYDVEVKMLLRAVRRNLKRFPYDFMFQLFEDEFNNLRYHFGTSKRGGRRYLPYAFTEQGVAMLSSILRSDKAIEIDIVIMRVFVMVARIIDSSKTLSEKIEDIEKEHQKSNQIIQKHDKGIKEIFSVINYLTERKKESDNNKEEIGFKCKN